MVLLTHQNPGTANISRDYIGFDTIAAAYQLGLMSAPLTNVSHRPQGQGRTADEIDPDSPEDTEVFAGVPKAESTFFTILDSRLEKLSVKRGDNECTYKPLLVFNPKKAADGAESKYEDLGCISLKIDNTNPKATDEVWTEDDRMEMEFINKGKKKTERKISVGDKGLRTVKCMIDGTKDEDGNLIERKLSWSEFCSNFKPGCRFLAFGRLGKRWTSNKNTWGHSIYLSKIVLIIRKVVVDEKIVEDDTGDIPEYLKKAMESGEGGAAEAKPSISAGAGSGAGAGDDHYGSAAASAPELGGGDDDDDDEHEVELDLGQDEEEEEEEEEEKKPAKKQQKKRKADASDAEVDGAGTKKSKKAKKSKKVVEE